jgi:hypothetical protein
MLPHCNGRQVSADRPEWISAEEQIAYRPAAVGKSTLSQVVTLSFEGSSSIRVIAGRLDVWDEDSVDVA